VVVLDDMIASGKTVSETVQATEQAGGTVWGVAATHGLFVGQDLGENLGCLRRLIVTDTIARLAALPSDLRERTEVISTAPMVAEAIRRIHKGTGSISDLLT
jgi:ribose-phosphate pyrophosphokinase